MRAHTQHTQHNMCARATAMPVSPAPALWLVGVISGGGDAVQVAGGMQEGGVIAWALVADGWGGGWVAQSWGCGSGSAAAAGVGGAGWHDVGCSHSRNTPARNQCWLRWARVVL